MNKPIYINLIISFFLFLILAALEYIGMAFNNQCWGLDIIQVGFYFPYLILYYFIGFLLLNKLWIAKEITWKKLIMVGLLSTGLWFGVSFLTVMQMHLSLGGKL